MPPASPPPTSINTTGNTTGNATDSGATAAALQMPPAKTLKGEYGPYLADDGLIEAVNVETAAVPQLPIQKLPRPRNRQQECIRVVSGSR